MELPRSSDHANQRKADKVQFIAALGWAAPARKLVGQQRRAPSPGPMARGRGLDGDGALAYERDRDCVGAGLGSRLRSATCGSRRDSTVRNQGDGGGRSAAIIYQASRAVSRCLVCCSILARFIKMTPVSDLSWSALNGLNRMREFRDTRLVVRRGGGAGAHHPVAAPCEWPGR